MEATTRTGQGPVVSRRAFGLGAAAVVLTGCDAGPTGDAPVTGAPAWTPSARTPPSHPRPLRPTVSLPRQLDPPPDTVIRGVQVFDGVWSQGPVDVLLKDGLIAAIGDVGVGDDAIEVEGAGRTLLPGLIDSHVHYRQVSGGEIGGLPFGVTTEIDLYSRPRGSLLEERQTTGRLAEPDVITAGYLATVPGGHSTRPRGMPLLEDDADADAWVADRVTEGSELVKIVVESNWGLPTLSPGMVGRLVEAAHDRGLMAVVHAHGLRDFEVAVDSGADGVVHTLLARSYPGALLDRILDQAIFVVGTLGILQRARDRAILKDPVAETLFPSAYRRFAHDTSDWYGVEGWDGDDHPGLATERRPGRGGSRRDDGAQRE